jgi:hypothetical protein
VATNRLLVWGAVAAGLAVVFGMFAGSRSSSDSSTSPSSDGSGGSGSISIPFGSGSNGGEFATVATVFQGTPLPDAGVQMDPLVNPVNVATDGAVYQGPDPLDLAPGEEGRGDLIAPLNPGNVVAGGPVYTGPDPLNLGGN